MRSTAFQPCITLGGGGGHIVKMVQNNDFLKRNGRKTLLFPGLNHMKAPEDSENVVVFGRGSFLTGIIAARSQQTSKFLVRPQK